jgi:hypothetical protein
MGGKRQGSGAGLHASGTPLCPVACPSHAVPFVHGQGLGVVGHGSACGVCCHVRGRPFVHGPACAACLCMDRGWVCGAGCDHAGLHMRGMLLCPAACPLRMGWGWAQLGMGLHTQGHPSPPCLRVPAPPCAPPSPFACTPPRCVHAPSPPSHLCATLLPVHVRAPPCSCVHIPSLVVCTCVPPSLSCARPPSVRVHAPSPFVCTPPLHLCACPLSVCVHVHPPPHHVHMEGACARNRGAHGWEGGCVHNCMCKWGGWEPHGIRGGCGPPHSWAPWWWGWGTQFPNPHPPLHSASVCTRVGGGQERGVKGWATHPVSARCPREWEGGHHLEVVSPLPFSLPLHPPHPLCAPLTICAPHVHPPPGCIPHRLRRQTGEGGGGDALG